MTGKPVFAESAREKVLFPAPAIPITRTRQPIDPTTPSTAPVSQAAMLATAAVALIVILGQAAGLNPNDPSSTAIVAVGMAPVFASLIVLVVWGIDRAVRAVAHS